jgi:hypothetical protein
MKLLRKHGFNPTLRNIGRLMFIMHNAFWATFFTWRESKVFREKISSWPVPDEPVIIIGHWRTGSTFLHLLMSQDEHFVSPTLFQAAFPECFLAADRFYRPVMGRMVNRRPMDNVQLGFDDAQEDEFALFKLTQESPLKDIVFPEQPGYFINHYEDFIPPPDKYSFWKEKIITFSKKIAQDSGRKLLLKNPAHSLRIPFLLETFPRARFIHIHRHPYEVVVSSLNLWKVLINDNLLKGKAEYPGLEDVATGLTKFYEVIGHDFKQVPEGRKSEVSYKDLVGDPIGQLRKIYEDLGLDFTAQFEEGISSFLERTRDFKKNSYTFEEKDKEDVYRLMEGIFKQYNYQR